MAPQLEINAGGPYLVEPNNTLNFNGTASGGYLPYLWHWDFGDGENSTLQNPTHSNIVLNLTDNLTTVVVDETIVVVGEPDVIPPEISIIKPTNGIYLNNNKLIPFLFPLIIGSIDIEINTYDESGIELIELYSYVFILT